MDRPLSTEIYAKACQLIPGGVNSPVRSFQGLQMAPMIVESGAGSVICDADGKKYIDYCMSWGALILGHAHRNVVRAASLQMERGSSFGIATAVEVEMAARIADLIHSVEKLRLVSSGTEAVMTALRLARGYTGKTKILKFSGHYHGHSDALLMRAGSGVSHLNPTATSQGVSRAVLADTLCFPFNDFETIRTFFRTDPLANELAAIILEPITGNMGVVFPAPGFLELLREETTKIGALLIFDEVITGFRVHLQGAQGLYGITPDLTCFGKIIGGGFPLAAVAGRREILDCLAPLGQVYQAGTLSGNPVAVAAGLATLAEIVQPAFYEALKIKTDRLLGPIREIVFRKSLNACVHQSGSMFSLFFGLRDVTCREDLHLLDSQLFGKFFRHLFQQGIYIPPSPHEAWFLSSAHTDAEIDATASCIVSFLTSL
ncbi:MAG: glutamate-1-semialdehyde 2,1-aminomutase [Chlamydiia bacterium]|nr:glutamate-1-semialdehyde 2,1-aminomutase [Chlamydiia bacterium]